MHYRKTTTVSNRRQRESIFPQTYNPLLRAITDYHDPSGKLYRTGGSF